MKVKPTKVKKLTYGLFVRGGNTHQKLAFTVGSTSAAEAMKVFSKHYRYKLGVNPDNMETFVAIPKIGEYYDWGSKDSNGWDLGKFYPKEA